MTRLQENVAAARAAVEKNAPEEGAPAIIPPFGSAR